jgi:hypothetical protein
MKILITTLAAAAVILSASLSETEAGSRSYSKHQNSGVSRSNPSYKRYSRRDYDRLPIRVTRPPNTGHYTFQGYPEWSARALEPARTR